MSFSVNFECFGSTSFYIKATELDALSYLQITHLETGMKYLYEYFHLFIFIKA